MVLLKSVDLGRFSRLGWMSPHPRVWTEQIGLGRIKKKHNKNSNNKKIPKETEVECGCSLEGRSGRN